MKDRSYMIKTLLTTVYALMIFCFLYSLIGLANRHAPDHYTFLGTLLFFSILVVGSVIIYRSKIISNHMLNLLFYWVFGLILTFFFIEIIAFSRNLYLYNLWNISESGISDTPNKFEYSMKNIGSASLGVFERFERGLGVDLSVHISCLLSIFVGLFIEFTWRKVTVSVVNRPKVLNYFFLGAIFLAINLLAVSWMDYSRESILVKLFFTITNLLITCFYTYWVFRFVRSVDRFIMFYIYFFVGILGSLFITVIWWFFIENFESFGLTLITQGWLQTLIWGYFFESYLFKRSEKIKAAL